MHQVRSTFSSHLRPAILRPTTQIARTVSWKSGAGIQSSWDPFGSTGKCCLRLCLDFLMKRAAQAQLQVLQVHQWQLPRVLGLLFHIHTQTTRECIDSAVPPVASTHVSSSRSENDEQQWPQKTPEAGLISKDFLLSLQSEEEGAIFVQQPSDDRSVCLSHALLTRRRIERASTSAAAVDSSRVFLFLMSSWICSKRLSPPLRRCGSSFTVD